MTVFEEGIDVSRYQGAVDWNAVRRAEKRFALVRLGSSNQSGPYVDPYFSRNVEQAHQAGLRVGAYYYTYAKTQQQVIAEITPLLKELEGKRLEYPVYVDVEDASLVSMGKDALTSLVKFSMDILDQKGWFPGYYSYTEFLRRNLDTRRLESYPLWVADYRGSVGYVGEYGMWQYSSVGRVDGVSGNVDLDYSYKDYLPEIRAAGKNGYGEQDPDCREEEYRQKWLASEKKLQQVREIVN